MIFDGDIFLVFVSFGEGRNEDSLAFRDFDDTVTEVLVLEVVVLFELGLGTVGAIKYEFVLFLFNDLALFGFFNWRQHHSLVLLLPRY